MSKIDITTSFLYRWRYWIGYTLIGIALISLLGVAAFVIPGGLTQSSLESIITSSQLDPSELWHQAPTHAPFYLLQHASLSLFGVSLIGVKLVSIILGLITALCMILLLRRWFSGGVAVLASLLAVTTGQFLFLTQQGDTSVLYLFWPTTLLLFATLAAKQVRFRSVWIILFFVIAALSLYTPLSIYVLIALASAILLHPHLRHIVKKVPRTPVIIGLALSLVLLTPLALTIVSNPSMLLQLLGAPHVWSISLLENIGELARQYFGFMSLGDKSVMLPVFGLGSMLIILYGLYRSMRTYETVRSHVILAWLVLLFPVLIVNPGFISIMFVPLLLLLASGMERILRSWYGIFPHNPYARVAGLIPLVILVGGLVLFGLERYSYGYRYTPEIVQNFSHDALIIPDVPNLVVTTDEQELYEAIAAYKHFSVMTTPPKDGTYAVTAAAYQGKKGVSQIVTVGSQEDAARFYIYK